MPDTVTLKRSLSLPVTSFYGIGTIIGAGIYVLIGKVSAVAGLFLPYAFLLAGIIAALTALSYAELSSRFPHSAGSAAYIHNAWQRRWLAQLVGFLVAVTGIVSAATIANGFVGYLELFVQIPDYLAITLLIALLTLIALWGINESALTVTIVTLIEVGGLLFVIAVSCQAPAVQEWSEIFAVPEIDAWAGVLVGSFLAFYAFIGFEDMVNLAEEVRNPRRTLPRAILIAIAVSTLLYMVVAALAVRTLPVPELAQSSAPLASMVTSAGHSTTFIGIISMFAVVNGALVQIIMASRLLYGMAKRELAPRIFAGVSARTQTPVVATLLVGTIILVFALWLPLTVLAKITAFIMLVIFSLVNLSLFAIKFRGAETEAGVVRYPIGFPALAFVLCVALIVFQFFA
ncbi:amino acid/polyamine/organocation transporter, APC superfamily [Microbulbifer donghaiensis]|uniref:Amino acid/polyamine/organocation transporter, APC superfamily n=1 Tax=Microbulbifer donghaiensis TaxID=494016 RepID=A0A1M5FMR6_9GAMM|nr:amino acid permease [Microbulbifer donghaiensis]SHF92793.1 amino acid/polyamine/organocation transporter, APC superfamily [Microbulbifer donghaiensis]